MSARFGDGVVSGMVLDVSEAGLGASFRAGESSDELLPEVGAFGELTIIPDWCRNSVVVDARLVHRAEVDGDLCLLGFEFSAKPTNLDSDLNALFNRRKALRVQPPYDRPVEVTLTADGEFQVAGTLIDISRMGLAIEVPGSTRWDPAWPKSAEVVATVGRGEEALQVSAVLRSRRWRDQSNVAYGFVFAVPESDTHIQERIDSYVEELQAQTPARSAP